MIIDQEVICHKLNVTCCVQGIASDTEIRVKNFAVWKKSIYKKNPVVIYLVSFYFSIACRILFNDSNFYTWKKKKTMSFQTRKGAEHNKHKVFFEENDVPTKISCYGQ